MFLIKSDAELQTALDAGPYTFPGCYPMFFITGDADALCFQCAQGNTDDIHTDIDGLAEWRIVGEDINWETPEMMCAHCSEPIPSAYETEETA